MSDKLKPCPFCGGEAGFERIGNARQSELIACEDCHCRLESNLGDWNAGEYWNTRPPIECVPTECQIFKEHGFMELFIRSWASEFEISGTVTDTKEDFVRCAKSILEKIKSSAK